VSFGTLSFSQVKKVSVHAPSRANKVERLVNSEKMLNKRIISVEKELKQLKEKQSVLRKRVNNQIEVELKQTNDEKEKLLSKKSQIKKEKEEMIKRSIEMEEKRIQNLKNLQEELKSKWKND